MAASRKRVGNGINGEAGRDDLKDYVLLSSDGSFRRKSFFFKPRQEEVAKAIKEHHIYVQANILIRGRTFTIKDSETIKGLARAV